MGMNYYAVKNRPSCYEPIHIGKSSFGWLFHFEENEYWSSYPEVKKWLQENTIGPDSEYVIVNEEDEIVSYEDLIAKIDQKQSDPKNLENPDNFTYCNNVDGYRFSKGYFS